MKKELHKLPNDMKQIIISSVDIKNVWEDITPLGRNEWICWVTSAKKEETRKHRIEVMLSQLQQGKRRPCCWPGCPHR